MGAACDCILIWMLRRRWCHCLARDRLLKRQIRVNRPQHLCSLRCKSGGLGLLAKHRTLSVSAVVIPILVLTGAAFGYWRWNHPALSKDIYVANGRLEATEVQIASKIAGHLAQVLVNEGDKVSTEQLLVRMDTSTLEAQLRQAQAVIYAASQNVAVAQANVQLRQTEQRLAGREFRRARQIFERGYYSAQLFDQHQAQFDTSGAAARSASARLQPLEAAIAEAVARAASLQSEIDDHSLRAPIDGLIQLRMAEPGEVLGAGGQVFVLIDLSDLSMNLYLPAATAGKLSIGDEAKIVLDALPGHRLGFLRDYITAFSLQPLFVMNIAHQQRQVRTRR